MNKKFTRLTAALALLVALAIPLGAWAENWSYTFNASSGIKKGDNTINGVTWNVDHDSEYQANEATGYHVGSGSKSVSYLQMSTSGISGTISSIVVNAKGNGTNGTISASVDGTAYNATDNSITNSFKNFTFTGSSEGTIVFRLEYPNAVTKNFYVASITVTYSTGNTPSTYTVTFDAGEGTFVGNTAFPNESNNVEAGTYSLPNATRENYTLLWSDGTDTYEAGDDYEVTEDVDFTAQWTATSGGGSGNVTTDVLNREFTGRPQSTSYGDWSNKEGASGAVYAGNSAGDKNTIQLRSNNSNSGVVTTVSGGLVKKVTVTWHDDTGNGRTLNVYGKNTEYSAASDLYGTNAGTLIGTIVKGTSTELSISDDYEFIGMRSASNAMYLTEIDIEWETGSSTEPSISGTAPAELTYDATSGQIGYTITNGVSGGTVSASVPSGSWITVPSGTITDNPFTFTCSANPNAAQRSETVTLTYTYNTDQTKTTSVTVTQAGNPNVVNNISDITGAGDYHVKGMVVATSSRGFIIGDGTGYVYTYLGDVPSCSVGDNLSITGTTSTSYGHVIQFTNAATIETVESTNYNGDPQPEVITEVPNYSEGNHLSTYLKFEGTLSKEISGNYTNYNIAVGEGTIRISYPTSVQVNALEALLNKTVRVHGFFVGISGTTFTAMMKSVEEVAVPTITLVPDNPIYTQDGYQLEFAYYSHGGAIDIVQYENFQDELTFEDFDIQYYDANSQPIETPDWLVGDGAVVELIGEVLYLNVAVKPNNTGAERSCYFKVWAYNGTTEVYSDLVTVHQADKPVINANNIVLSHDATSGSIAYTISNPIANTSLTATLQEGIDWISDINVGETAVTFNTTVNTGAIRTATITLTYKDTDNYTHATKVVTVTQIMPSETGTITFGNSAGSTNINGANITGKDNLGNEWTITTTGTNSFTPNSNYAQVGSSGNPAGTITFTTSLGAGTTIASIEAKFGGFSATTGDINLFVDNTNVGVDALNGTTDVIVQSTTIQEGNAISVTVSNITGGVKCYYISYSYVASTAPYINAEAALPLAYDATSGSIAYEIGNPVEGGVLTATINDGSTIADLAIGTITNTAVPFTCSANTATTQHTATITLTYKDANNQILATKEVTLTQDRVPMQNVTMAFHPTAAMATIGIAEFTAPTLTIDPAVTVTYSSSNTTVATVDETSGVVTIGNSAGITEITATFAGNDAYYTASALYTLFVNDNPDIPILTVDEEYITPTTAPVLWTPCSGVTSYTLDLAPVAISESFEEGLIPEGWTKPETNVSIASGKGGDGDYCVAFKAKDAYLITPALNNPKAISFMYKRSSNSTDWSLDISYATSLNAEIWTNIGTVDDATTTWKTYSASLDVTGEVYIKFTDTRSTGTHERYIDLVQIAGEYTSQSVTGTSYTFENLAAGATYYARVIGNSEYSNVVSFTTLPFTLDIAGYGDSTKDGYYLIASPVGVVTPTAANGFLTSEYDLYIFDESQNSAEWRNYEVMAEGDNPQHANFSTLEPGKGYLYASETNTTLKFTGTPYDGEGIFELSKTEGKQLSGWNLVGNPFATDASIDKVDFYVMNEAGNEIVPAENSTIAPMQGVFILAEGEGDNVTFTPGSTDAFNQSITAQVSQNRGNVIDRVRVRFGEGRQLPKFMLNSDNTKLYIPQGNKDYAVVRSAAQGEMPVNFKAENNGTYTLSVNAENVEMNYLHLIDNKTGADVDLLATPSYTFEANTTDYASRFRLVFSANNGSNENGNETFAYYNGSEWMINNMGDATLQVVDVMGRVLSTETVSGNATINLNQTPGVYMLRLVNGDSVKVQKVVVR